MWAVRLLLYPKLHNRAGHKASYWYVGMGALMLTYYNYIFFYYQRIDALTGNQYYYLDPKKATSGRTNSEPRGFGATLDAFTRGKLTEVGIKRMIEKLAPIKCGLDFDMKNPSEVRVEPDIITIKENGVIREPKIFTEIKNTSVNDRWIGVTDEQLNSMKEGSNGRDIYMIYSSLKGARVEGNSKTSDFVGMYLKHISGLDIFSNFSDLSAKANLEFILSTNELEKYGTPFPAGDLTYETNLFDGPKIIHKKDGTLRSGIELDGEYRSYGGKIHVKRKDGQIDNKHGLFNLSGDFDIFKKVNEKSIRSYIRCLSDVKVSNDTFGSYFLEKGKIYNFILETLGRDPILKRNNLFIAKRKVYQLIENKILSEPDSILNNIANKL